MFRRGGTHRSTAFLFAQRSGEFQRRHALHDLDSMKIDAQKRAAREGFDMDIIPSDLATYAGEAKNILRDLQSRNERMFLLTFLVVNVADTKQKLDNTYFFENSQLIL